MKDVLKAVVVGGLFAVPFLTLYVENDYFFPFITGKNFGFRIIVDVVFAAWVILAFYEVQYRPKISGITWSFGALLIVMFVADLFGLHPQSSFWSNFERMDGYVSLVHTFLYMLVLGSMLKTKTHWQYLLNTSLFVAMVVAIYGLAQYGGLIPGSDRIDSRLGNAAYMAVYMLFHIFVAFWLFVESKNWLHKILYALLAVMMTFVLVETGTRGTAVGLAVGVAVMSAYIGLFGAEFKQYRKYAIGGFLVLLVAVGAFIGARDSEFVQSNGNLARIANISLDDLRIRSIIWGMAWDGVKERPILGYGQSNFNYVFNENYDPRLYAQEQWFDRAHNIFMDWLVTGGFVGLIVYLSIFAWCGWYLFVRPLIQEDHSFTVMERGVLLGILAGYFTHNLVVFDNIVSYIFFAIILALITSRVGAVPKQIANAKVDGMVVAQVVAPVMIVVLCTSFWFWHRPGMAAAGDIIDAFRSQDPAVQLAEFKQAIDRGSFAQQEITEQLAQRAMNFASQQQVPAEVRDEFVSYSEEQLLRLAESKPNDARIHVFIGSFYRSTGNVDKAREQLAIARTLSPKKQAIINQQGFIELASGNYELGRDYFKESFELDTNNLESREYYAGSLFYTGQFDEAKALMDSKAAERRFAQSDFIVGAANQFGQTEFLTDLFEIRVTTQPDGQQQWQQDPQTWASLAFLYYQAGSTTEAVATLEEAGVAVPSFAPMAACVIGNIEAGREPNEGCQ